jgi:hypothetical protein
VDLTDGTFRHLVVTGRSRLALYLARIPAGLAIIGPLVAIGFAIVCAVSSFAAPTTLNYRGVDVPGGLSRPALETWASGHAEQVVCGFNSSGPIPFNLPCLNVPDSGPKGQTSNGSPGSGTVGQPSRAELKAQAVKVADQDYADYSKFFLAPSTSLMIKTGLWLELEALIGFVVGLGLGALLGQRTVAVIMMIVLEIILTPIFARARIPHFINLQRAVVGLATAHLEPHALPLALGGARGVDLLPESTTVAICVIVAWLVGWTALGAWRMVKRDA